ncbi:hypothetical protein Cgig2_003345 [Carnegiea gigantea]|uniref:DUF4408 domain-containing protein n=1 Tax=Carnegiea gigantea TaxID=171969 RepID=A0A9Q1K0K5_9CARY|nr:hypothetical protein Cgig2_003345 [Carnegiea gigantea]
MATVNTLIHSLKIILISSGALFIVALLSLSLNPLLATSASEFPTLWSTLSAWLRPPYLYVIINGIIITIAASSRMHQHHAPSPEDTLPNMAPPPQHHVRTEQFSLYESGSGSLAEVEGSYYGGVSVKDVDVEVVKSVVSAEIEARESRIVEEVKAPVVEFEIAEAEIGDEIEESSSVADEISMWTPPLARQQPVPLEFFSERPPASSRFGHHRRPAKASPGEGGKALRRVAKPKRHETLENTWKAITEGRAMPLTRHLKKSDTWENHSRDINFLDSSSDDPAVKKSETFNDRTNYAPPPVPGSRLKKEPSPSQDDLNRRVEAFIKKFNEEMRLQRQQSIEQFMDRINRI